MQREIDGHNYTEAERRTVRQTEIDSVRDRPRRRQRDRDKDKETGRVI